MTIKASELRKLLGDVPNANEIIADRIQKGEVEDDGAGTNMFKSEAFEALTKSLLDSVAKLQAVPTEPEKRVDVKAERLAKSAAAENAPEVVAAINETGSILEAIEKSLTASQSVLAKGLAIASEAHAASLKGLADFATQFQALQSKVDELHKSASAPVAPAGQGAGAVVASAFDTAQAAAATGAEADAAFAASFAEADRLIKGRLVKLAAGEIPASEGARLTQASFNLLSGTMNPAELIAEFGLK